MEETKELDYSTLYKELIEIYEGYLANPKDKNIKNKAQEIYLEYWKAEALFDSNTRKAINLLLRIGIDLAPLLKKEEIQELIDFLKNNTKSKKK
ncbi:MAG TPA: hypothetical protein HA360_04290 [Nanoarchaeota archaeon]|nr:hypothetical protein [Candidatus Woesearchaeota archaeon]HIH58498.1 hypothetical protein [Nanoarchaeota archaeon]HII14267.1 hypothetical protein [Nanoarchaeota archaeon]HIJ05043.1 hypothetical protein [Nanoarchaeota archaeon]